ncbi:SPOSA6832_00606, partial [Sporobolomyces salmonicolor]
PSQHELFRHGSEVELRQRSVGLQRELSCEVKLTQLPPPDSYGYTPSIAMCAVFLALYALSMVVHLGQTFKARRYWWMLLMPVGCLLELVGWAMRAYSHSDPSARSPYIGQLALLVIAPTFFSAALYWSLGLIIADVAPTRCWLSAKWFKALFLTADVISLVIQAVGGGMAGSAGDDVEKLKNGSKCALLPLLPLAASPPGLTFSSTFSSIMLAGIAVQLAVMVLFVLYGSAWVLRAFREVRQSGRKMHLMLFALAIGSAAVIVRGVTQIMMLFDAIPISVIVHPAWFLVVSPHLRQDEEMSQTTMVQMTDRDSLERMK